jgi:uncharacterized membrane protein YphA (DoxX/SURF4 family)
VTSEAVGTSLLILRLDRGVTLLMHGANKVFGPGGLERTARYLAGLGFRPARLHVRLAAAIKLAAGLITAIRLLTLAAGAACVGLMTVAALTDHRRPACLRRTGSPRSWAGKHVRRVIYFHPVTGMTVRCTRCGSVRLTLEGRDLIVRPSPSITPRSSDS